MSISHSHRRSTDAEIVAEMDRRGVVIEKLEAEIDRLRIQAASPTSGRVSRADLERATEARHSAWHGSESWVRQTRFRRAAEINAVAAALQALGLSLEPGIQDEGGV